MLTSQQLREKFLKYFNSLEHTIVKSDSLIPSSDPTLLFTSAGMVQFKDNFLGIKKDLKRATSVQKCFRTTDIEKVGHTFRHLTFFEMLGNFSFGDYFKKEAIVWAWEFLTKVCEIDKKLLYITVYKDDNESYQLWEKIVGKDRIYKLGDETNFWRMGNTGPCGPCSEILVDLGEEYGCKKSTCGPACDCDRYLEVWNLVFTQFDCQQDGSLKPLSQKNIDTGMGLERLNMVVNNKKTVFETDIFEDLKIELKKTLDKNNIEVSKEKNIYLNALLDHSRAATFISSEGILPSNEGRGYVLRKVIRRGVRCAKLLGINEPLLFKMAGAVSEIMKEQYPEILLHREKIALIIKNEEEKFLETLDFGTKILNEIISSGRKQISAEEVFKLYDTYGFPEELVREILAEQNITYDKTEFDKIVQKARETSRASWKGVEITNKNIYKQFPETEFVGYKETFSESKILGIIKNNEIVPTANQNDIVEIIFDTTPSYGESGGQVGDTGWIKIQDENKNLKIVAEVLDTKKFDERIVHICKILDKEIKSGTKFLLEINSERRKDIARHHTATHLLHKALRTVVGEHATQSGSLVSDEYFRFDFIHHRPLSEEEILRIEEIVNQKILSCLEVNIEYTDLQTAKNMGATALFEEKYGDKVRVVSIGSSNEKFSVELCGGTHCKNTGEIGLFKIISEYSVGTNLRRIEAICGIKVYKQLVNYEKKLNSISQMLSTTPKEIEIKIDRLLKQNKQLIDDLNKTKLQFTTSQSKETVQKIKDLTVVIQKIENIDGNLLRNLSDKIVEKYKQDVAVIILFSQVEEKTNIVLRLTPKSLEKNLSLELFSSIIQKEFGIKTGGRKDFVQGGGKLTRKLSEEDLLIAIEKSL